MSTTETKIIVTSIPICLYVCNNVTISITTRSHPHHEWMSRLMDGFYSVMHWRKVCVASASMRMYVCVRIEAPIYVPTRIHIHIYNTLFHTWAPTKLFMPSMHLFIAIYTLFTGTAVHWFIIFTPWPLFCHLLLHFVPYTLINSWYLFKQNPYWYPSATR